MSWIQVLSDTYDRIEALKPWENDDSIEPLLPVGQLYVKAQLTVTIDEKGDFLRAEIENEGLLTPTPCTEDSASRSGLKAALSPHVLADKLYYFAGNLIPYGLDNKKSYDALMDIYKSWIEANPPRCVRALNNYLQKQSIANDLMKAGLIIYDDKKEVTWNIDRLAKVPKIKPFDIYVRWIVRESDVDEHCLWKRKDVAQSWLNYYLENKKEEGYCQVSGSWEKMAVNHPKNINPLAANAKIISSNDSSGYTYRGRLTASDQVNQVSYIHSQKAHNALRYLVMNQGMSRSTSSFVTWTRKLAEPITPMSDTGSMFNTWVMPYEDNLGNDLAFIIKKRLDGMKGRSTTDSELDKVYFMILEAVTNGRMTIAYFKEFNEADYLQRLMNWHMTCRWQLSYYQKDNEGKTEKKDYIGAPTVYDIINLVYGKPKDSDGKSIPISDTLFLSARDRLFDCIVEGGPLPVDMVRGAIYQVSNRLRYHQELDYYRALAIACAMINKANIDRNKEGFELALEENRRTRDYLYGRLLALAQNIESWSIKDSGNENRMTNADRLMQRFSQRPYTTWQTIELAMKPYQQRLGDKCNGRMRLLDEIMGLFELESFLDNRPLSGEFLIGYHCQRQALYTKKEQEEVVL